MADSALLADNGNSVQDAADYSREKKRIDLVLTDMMMPRMGGMELIDHLRERDPQLSIVLMTGYPLEQDGREALAREKTGWMQKPVTPGKLGRVLSEALNSRGGDPSGGNGNHGSRGA